MRWTMAVWGLHLMIIVTVGINAAFAQGGTEKDARDRLVAENDALAYWAKRLNGVQMHSSMRAMVSPLTASEIAQYFINVAGGKGGQFLQSHGAAFCKAARIQCKPLSLLQSKKYAESEPHPEKYNQRAEEVGLTGLNEEDFENQKAQRAEKVGLYGWKEEDPENEQAAARGHPEKDNQRAEEVGLTGLNEEDNENNQKAQRAEKVGLFFWKEENPENGEAAGRDHPEKDNQRAEEVGLTGLNEEHNENQKVQRAEKVGLYGWKEEDPENEQAAARAHPENINLHLRLRARNADSWPVSTPSDSHVLTSLAFREKQVLVSGIDIRENYATYNGDAEIDNAAGRSFLPRRLANLFSLDDRGARNLRLLGVRNKELQNTLRNCRASKSMKCLTSIEDVADFVAAELDAGPDADIVMYDTIVNASHVERHEAGDTFHVVDVKDLTENSEPFVGCHDRMFPFRLFICHHVAQSHVFQVTLQGEDGETHQRIAVCHYDGSRRHLPPQTLEKLLVKPGEEFEVCHWFGGMSLRHAGFVFVRQAAITPASMASS